MSDKRQSLRRKIDVLESELLALREEEALLAGREEFEKLREEATLISLQMDNWVKGLSSPLTEKNKDLLSILFLGGCSGVWAARSRYRGQLPPFGGFLIYAGEQLLLVDPGRSTFKNMLSVGIHPSMLDALVVTHAHWDCVRDAGLILSAASPLSREFPQTINNNLRLYADQSALMGISMDPETMLEPLRKAMPEGADVNAREISTERLSLFPMAQPPALHSYDLFIRLGGRFTKLEIGDRYTLSPAVDLYTRRSYHRVTFGVDHIPALDLVVKSRGRPAARMVYLSDSEYRKELAEQYAVDGLKPIDVLICNVKTLDVLPYPKDDPMAGYTQHHLGWEGLLQVTHDFKRLGLLKPSSLVVLRAWGIETVTTIDPVDKALVATPEKLEMYAAQYTRETKQRCIVPGITWVRVPHGKRNTPVHHHIRPPYAPRGQSRSFGGICYQSEVMHGVAKQAMSMTDLHESVLVVSEPGAGKDLLAHSIHDMAVQQGKRSDRLFRENGRTLSKLQVQAQLFGYSGGAFNGAVEPQKGWFEEARDGTLIIEDFIKMGKELQGKFVRILEHRTYQRLGDQKSFDLKAQVIFTTSENLTEAVEQGRLRRDLYDLLDGKGIVVPPLRDRKEDIPGIIDGLRRSALADDIEIPQPDSDVIKLLVEYDWPGNVRQPKNVLIRVASTGDWSVENVMDIVGDEHSRYPNPGDGQEPENRLDVIEEAILSLLDVHNTLSQRDIRERLQDNPDTRKSPYTINARVNRLIRRGLVRRIDKGPNTRYSLSQHRR